MIAALSLLAMGAGSSLALGSTAAGTYRSVLEAGPQVQISYRDMVRHSNVDATGVAFAGGPETRFACVFTLTWPLATEGIRQHIRMQWATFLHYGSQPFSWVRPGTAEVYTVKHDGPPRYSVAGRQAGTASVVLVEQLLTD